MNAMLHDRAVALDYLLSRINYERTADIPYRSGALKLDRMRRLLELAGDPHLGLPCVHVAGTKGKGSTSAMLAAALRHAGFCTGLYTSPHLERIEERFAIDGEPISSEQFVALAEELRQVAEQLDREPPAAGAAQGGPTFFELTTALAFLFFRRRPVDIAVLEVGLGGRLDSTNVCQPETCVITSISFDHMRQLGHTLPEIAREKAGIIKPGVPIVSGVQSPAPRDTIAAIAHEVGAPLVQAGRDFTGLPLEDTGNLYAPFGCSQAVIYTEPAAAPQHWLGPLPVGLAGKRQLENAAVAVAALQQLRRRGWQIPDAAIAAGLASAQAPGRQELIVRRPQGLPDVLLDVAHNAASIAALADELSTRFTARRKLLVFASSRDKEAAAMLALLAPQVSVAILTRFVQNPRAFSPEELLARWPQQAAETHTARSQAPPVLLETAADPGAALARVSALAQPDDLLVVAGSFFLIAEVRSLLAVA